MNHFLMIITIIFNVQLSSKNAYTHNKLYILQINFYYFCNLILNTVLQKCKDLP